MKWRVLWGCCREKKKTESGEKETTLKVRSRHTGRRWVGVSRDGNRIRLGNDAAAVASSAAVGINGSGGGGLSLGNVRGNGEERSEEVH
jgi:hypothetical protein